MEKQCKHCGERYIPEKDLPHCLVLENCVSWENPNPLPWTLLTKNKLIVPDTAHTKPSTAKGIIDIESFRATRLVVKGKI